MMKEKLIEAAEWIRGSLVKRAEAIREDQKRDAAWKGQRVDGVVRMPTIEMMEGAYRETRDETVFDITMKEGGKSDSVRYLGEPVSAALSNKVGLEGYAVTPMGDFQLDPIYTQYQLRGFARDYGRYSRMMNLPIFDGIWEEMVQGIVSMQRRVKLRELPKALDTAKNRAAQKAQFEYCEALWYLLQEGGRQNRAEKFVDDIIRSVTKNGFYLGEIVAKRKVEMKLSGLGEVEALVPESPHIRLANAVRFWVMDKDEVKGIIFNFTQTKWSTGIGDSWKVVPIGKMVHVFGRSEGISNPEGRSSFRSQLTMAEMLRDAFILEALAVEINALGTLLIRVKDEATEDDIRKLREYIATYKASDIPALVSNVIDDAKYMSPQAATPELGGIIGRYERNISWAHGREGRLIGVQKHGSNAARESGQSQGFAFNPYMVRMYVEHGVEQLFRRLILANKCFKEDVEAGRLFVPKLVHGVAEGEDTAKLSAELTPLVEKNILTREEARTLLLPAYGLSESEVVDEKKEADPRPLESVREEPGESGDGSRVDVRVDSDVEEERGR